MGAPVLPYFGGEPFGIRPPTPVTVATSYLPLGSVGNQYRTPCLHTADGSYYMQDGYASISLYNASNALVYNIPASSGGSVVSNCDYLLGLCYATDGFYYTIPYYGAGKTAKLAKLSTSSNVLTGVGAGFSTTDAMFGGPMATTLWEQTDGNLRLRCTNNTYITDLVVTKSGSKVSESRVAYAGRNLGGYPISYMQYETQDGNLIQCGWSIIDGALWIARNGKYAQVAIPWIKVSQNATSYPVLIRRWGAYVNVAPYSMLQGVGVTGLVAADFDRWLLDITNAYGM